MKEIWKPIEKYEDLYEVSSRGRVRSKNAVIKNGAKSTYKKVGKLKKPTNSIVSGKSMYSRVVLYKNNKGETLYVHRLVAQTFIPNPLKKRKVNHIDNNGLNNKVENLEWTTPKENIRHSVKQQRHSFGDRNGQSNINNQQVLEIFLCDNATPVELARTYNINSWTVNAIWNKRGWTLVTASAVEPSTRLLYRKKTHCNYGHLLKAMSTNGRLWCPTCVSIRKQLKINSPRSNTT